VLYICIPGRNTHPTKCTVLFLRYLYFIILHLIFSVICSIYIRNNIVHFLFECWELVMDNAWSEQYNMYILDRLFTVSGKFTVSLACVRYYKKVLQYRPPPHPPPAFPYPPNLRCSIHSCSIVVCGFLYVKIPDFPLLGDWSWCGN
jgi:hypothetical protein